MPAQVVEQTLSGANGANRSASARLLPQVSRQVSRSQTSTNDVAVISTAVRGRMISLQKPGSTVPAAVVETPRQRQRGRRDRCGQTGHRKCATDDVAEPIRDVHRMVSLQLIARRGTRAGGAAPGLREQQACGTRPKFIRNNWLRHKPPCAARSGRSRCQVIRHRAELIRARGPCPNHDSRRLRAAPSPSPGGGTGRRNGLKIRRPQGHTGSRPVRGTSIGMSI